MALFLLLCVCDTLCECFNSSFFQCIHYLLLLSFLTAQVNGVEGRTLGQIASTVYFTDARREREFKDFWRSSVVFSRDVFQCAARVVATLGLHRFSAVSLLYVPLHISCESLSHNLTRSP